MISTMLLLVIMMQRTIFVIWLHSWGTSWYQGYQEIHQRQSMIYLGKLQ